MSNGRDIVEWFNYDAIFGNGGQINLIPSKYQNELEDDIKALFKEVCDRDYKVMFKLGEMLSWRSIDASLWFQSEKHREYKYNAWILMGLGFKQFYPSYQKEILATHYPGKIADLINIDGIANINILNQVRNEAKRFLFKH
jgi:hypothetical protein